MEKLIQDQIARLAVEQGIKVLFAAEAGSRAWGFESPDSDYDVRLIYTFPRERYIQVEAVVQDINLPVDENLIDLSAWELIKTARLVVNKGNASPFEWIQSPIVYHEEPGFKEAFEQSLSTYFRPKAMIYHYMGLAKGTYFGHLQGEEVKIKKYFYALRPILCARWIQEYNTVPPLVFDEVRAVLDNDSVNQAIEQLLKEKETAVEGQLMKPVPVLQEFIREQLEVLVATDKLLQEPVPSASIMNQFLQQWIR